MDQVAARLDEQGFQRQPIQQPPPIPLHHQQQQQQQQHGVDAQTKQQSLQLITEAIYRLRQYGAHDVDCRTTAQYETELHRVMLDTSKYKPGNTQRHLAAWEIWLQQEPYRAQAKEAKRVFEEGVRFDFVHPKSRPQQQHPKHEQKLQQVERLLRKLMGPGEAR